MCIRDRAIGRAEPEITGVILENGLNVIAWQMPRGDRKDAAFPGRLAKLNCPSALNAKPKKLIFCLRDRLDYRVGGAQVRRKPSKTVEAGGPSRCTKPEAPRSIFQERQDLSVGKAVAGAAIALPFSPEWGGREQRPYRGQGDHCGSRLTCSDGFHASVGHPEIPRRVH